MSERYLQYLVYYVQLNKHHPHVTREADRLKISRNAKNFRIHDRKCYYIGKGKGKRRLVVMKYDTRRNLLKKHHLHSNGDHKGIVLTRTGITKSFYWNGITKDVENMVKSCPHCNAVNNDRKRQFSHHTQSITTTKVWNTLALTFLGPFRETSLGNHYGCLLTDYVSKFVFGKATFSLQQNSVCRMIRSACYQYGAPHTIVLANKGSTVEYTLELQSLGMEVVPFTQYTQVCLDHFENVTAPMKEKLKKMHGTKWQEQVEPMIFAHNTKYDPKLGCSPFQKMFNRPATSSRDIKPTDYIADISDSEYDIDLSTMDDDDYADLQDLELDEPTTDEELMVSDGDATELQVAEDSEVYYVIQSDEQVGEQMGTAVSELEIETTEVDEQQYS